MKIGGGEAISLALTELVTRSQIYSLFGALIIVWLLVLFLFRSFKLATLGLIPCVFALMGIFASMAIFDIELDIITSLLAALAIGIGVDYAIHLIAAYVRIGATLPQEEVFPEVMKTTGKAILINAASVTLGFMCLLFSRFTPISRMGRLFCIAMVFASLSSLTIHAGPASSYHSKETGCSYLKQQTKENQKMKINPIPIILTLLFAAADPNYKQPPDPQEIMDKVMEVQSSNSSALDLGLTLIDSGGTRTHKKTADALLTENGRTLP